MHVVLQIAEGWLELNAPDVGLAERRPVTASDQEQGNAWATQYRRLLGREGAEARLVALGREMYAWLDGEARWLDRLLADRVPLVLEVQAPVVPDALAEPGRPAADRAGLRLASCSGAAVGSRWRGEKGHALTRAPAGAGGTG